MEKIVSDNKNTRSSAGATSRNASAGLTHLLQENREGKRKGIYSVCTANRLALEAAFAQAGNDESLLLIEATCNQVNQDGGYTGMVPAQFRDYIEDLAHEMDFPMERVVLGGDHLGPNPWRGKAAHEAMEKACVMMTAFARAGFSKIHLDTSMACADDASPLSGMEIEVTSVEDLRETLEVHREAFARRGLQSAWERIVGVVVQPGVEFGHDTVEDYQPDKAAQLSASILACEGIVFEAHSTDYQTADALGQLVRDHFGILKVGPELTFVMREAIFGLARIEEECIAETQRSHLRAVIERVMLDQPENWRGYYHGDERQQRIARAYSLSDRIRYYWPNREIVRALNTLIGNLRDQGAPLSLVSQYLPRQAEAIRAGTISNDPVAMIHDKVRESLTRYAGACGLSRLM
jgi:D-tagatose-1,6-bisphosphate aldolase subunit GatZ/KbaZ